MNEEKTVSEQELDKVSGGTDGEDGFEAAWDKFARTYCDDCAIYDGGMICDAERRRVRAQWEAGQPLKCWAYMSNC